MLRYTNRLVHRTIPLLYRTACLHAHTFVHRARTSCVFCARDLFSSTRGFAVWSTATCAVLHVRSPRSPEALFTDASSSGSSTRRRYCSALFRMKGSGLPRACCPCLPRVLTASATWLAACITGSRQRIGSLHRCIRLSAQCGCCGKCKTAARGQPFACSLVMNRYTRAVTIAPLQVHGDRLRSVQSPLPRDRQCGRVRCPACPHCAHRRTNPW